jgi:methyl-accepting chemotaxis protein
LFTLLSCHIWQCTTLIVADEVRKLANRSRVESKEIGSLIKRIQGSINDTVTAMELGVKEVQHGELLAKEAGQLLTTSML